MRPSRLLCVLTFALTAASAGGQIPGALGVEGGVTQLTEDFVIGFRTEGAGDLNGDGDTDDGVPWILDRRTGLEVTVPVAIRSAFPGNGRFLSYRVDELFHGADLSGDGVLDDEVPMLVDLRTGAHRVLPFPTAFGIARLNDTSAVFLVVEDTVDLNGDGDTEDSVAHLHDLRTGQTQNLGLALVSVSHAIPGEDHFALLVSEQAQGGTDLTGDGSTNFIALHLVDASGAVTNTGLAPFGQTVASGDTLVLAAHENLSGADLDGDGQQFGSVLSLLDMETGVLRLTDVSQGALSVDDDPPIELGGYLFVRVSSAYRRIDPVTLDVVLSQKPFPVSDRLFLGGVAEQGTDLNNDGDGFDGVAHLFDVDTLAPVLNIGVSPFGLSQGESNAVDGRVLALNLAEQAHAGRDRNLDGDPQDAVLVTHDLLTGRQNEIPMAISSLTVSSGLVIFQVSEDAQGETDLNGDGDADDHLFFVHDVRRGTVQPLGASAETVVTAGRSVGFTVRESEEGVDLNGDGDLDDSFAHVVTF